MGFYLIHPQPSYVMKPSAAASLASIALLLTLVCIGTALTKSQSAKSVPKESLASGQKPNHSSPSSNPTLPGHISRASNNLSKRTSIHNKLPSSTQPMPGLSHLSSSQRQALLNQLSNDESQLTSETLADGTQLIHLNGTQGHLSSASLAADGSIQTQCHNNLDALLNNIAPAISYPERLNSSALIK